MQLQKMLLGPRSIYCSFRQVFEDHLDYPIAATVIGADTTMTEIDFDGDDSPVRQLPNLRETSWRGWQTAW